jgi:hypothetical protein
MLRRLYPIALFAIASTSLYAAKITPQPPLLPTDFAGWHETAPEQRSTAPESADQPSATVLHEYGFAQFASAKYTQADNQLSVRAIRFEDATGAYGAFTFYRRPGMLKEDIGNEGAFDGARVLFWTGTTLVDATFDHLTAMSAAQLRELSDNLPKNNGPSDVAPPLPKYLPTTALDPGSVRYAIGPLAYARGGGVLPPDMVGFDRDAEAVTAHYASSNGGGTLTLLIYPTPQIAMNREQAIQQLIKAGNTPQSVGLLVRRSGPIVAITSGSFAENEARKLLGSVNYSADVTWNHPEGYVSEASKAARLLLGIATLTTILGGTAIFLGFFLGSGRAVVRRLRGKPPSTLNDDEFISLKLR